MSRTENIQYLINTYEYDKKTGKKEYTRRIGWILHIYKEWIGFNDVRKKITGNQRFHIGVFRNDSGKKYYENFHTWIKKELNKLTTSKKKDLKKRWANISQLVKFTILEPTHSGGSSHYIACILNTKKNILYIFDPAMGMENKATYDGNIIYEALNIFSEKYNLNIIKKVPSKPMQQDITDVFCQTWSLKFLDVKNIKNIDKNPNFFKKTTEEEQKTYIKKVIIENIKRFNKDFDSYLNKYLKEDESEIIDSENPDGSSISKDLEKISGLSYIENSYLKDIFMS